MRLVWANAIMYVVLLFYKNNKYNNNMKQILYIYNIIK